MPSAVKAHIEIDPEVNDRLQKLAAGRHRQPDRLLREAVEQYVEREEKHDALWRDGVLSLDDYEATGLHVTGDEVVAWLETWVTKTRRPRRNAIGKIERRLTARSAARA